jgi:hypothetical protein
MPSKTITLRRDATVAEAEHRETVYGGVRWSLRLELDAGGHAWAAVPFPGPADRRPRNLGPRRAALEKFALAMEMLGVDYARCRSDDELARALIGARCPSADLLDLCCPILPAHLYPVGHPRHRRRPAPPEEGS